ncbi:hypothetical protein Hamer_G015918 [Homarus americanus]|uniref:Uncharacterized protein n=1 Tax=Homarus americanus TaxID=6706 RepID=A0A8J5MMK2_HOMAM|nr:hypothetical protein Hamer_G015918 [Homarus americanus]
MREADSDEDDDGKEVKGDSVVDGRLCCLSRQLRASVRLQLSVGVVRVVSQCWMVGVNPDRTTGNLWPRFRFLLEFASSVDPEVYDMKNATRTRGAEVNTMILFLRALVAKPPSTPALSVCQTGATGFLGSRDGDDRGGGVEGGMKARKERQRRAGRNGEMREWKGKGRCILKLQLLSSAFRPEHRLPTSALKKD